METWLSWFPLLRTFDCEIDQETVTWTQRVLVSVQLFAYVTSELLPTTPLCSELGGPDSCKPYLPGTFANHISQGPFSGSEIISYGHQETQMSILAVTKQFGIICIVFWGF